MGVEREGAEGEGSVAEGLGQGGGSGVEPGPTFIMKDSETERKKLIDEAANIRAEVIALRRAPMIVSNSEIACFRRCPREHHYRYVERVEPIVPADALVRGRRIHEALANLWTGRDVSLDGLSPADRAMMRAYRAVHGPVWSLRDRMVANVPFRVELVAGVTLVGELDELGIDAERKEIIVEHKTTSSDVSPGSAYWRDVVTTNSQASAYCLAFPRATILWDALRKPTLRQLQANKSRREPESDEAYEQRCYEQLTSEPENFFARAKIVRLESELEAYKQDVRDVGNVIWTSWDGKAYRNPDACHTFGRPCDFFDVCWGSSTLDSPQFRRVEKNHTEQVADRYLNSIEIRAHKWKEVAK